MSEGTLDAVWMRGGTSKGLFLQHEDVPPAGRDRDRLFLNLLGSPDPMQIDGLGGGVSSTSKVVVVRRSEREDCDIDYLFAQVGVRDAVVDYRPNCGNLTAAVGPYAIDEGLVAPPRGPVASLVLHNCNTGVRIRSLVPVVDGHAAVDGDHRISGVPNPGARIVNEYLDPAGAVLGQGLLPTGQSRDTIRAPGGDIEASIVDAGNLLVFLRARDVGLDGSELPSEVNEDLKFLERMESIRGTAAVMLGLADEPGRAFTQSPITPLPCLVSPAEDYEASDGTRIPTSAMDLRARAFSLQRMHHAYPLTGIVCTSAAAFIPESLVADVHSPRTEGEVRIGHAKGVAAGEVAIRSNPSASPIASVGVTRTARRLMAGCVFLR